MIDNPEPASGTNLGPNHGRRGFRRPIIASAAAVGLIASVGAGAAATADNGIARLLSARPSSAPLSSSATVASSVDGALVDIVSTLGYQGASAAGTGMVLSSDGEVLTNNHVIDGATSLKVTVVSTGRTYTATVVGTDPSDDVAVIQLQGASGLKTLPIGNSAAVRVGQRVVASGNAGGVGGTPSVVSGTVTALNRSITASDQGGTNAEQLSGLIETDAPIVAGDSGGALATTSGLVIGMNTAAAQTNSAFGSGAGGQSAASDAYAIPIQTALSIAQKIESGQASSTIHLGTRGFLGVELAASAAGGFEGGFGGGFGSIGSGSPVAGALLAGTFPGGGAAAAGLGAGDVITSVDGRAVSSASALSALMATTRSGQKITLGWTDADGTAHTASITLTPAPAD